MTEQIEHVFLYQADPERWADNNTGLLEDVVWQRKVFGVTKLERSDFAKWQSVLGAAGVEAWAVPELAAAEIVELLFVDFPDDNTCLKTDTCDIDLQGDGYNAKVVHRIEHPDTNSATVDLALFDTDEQRTDCSVILAYRQKVSGELYRAGWMECDGQYWTLIEFERFAGKKVYGMSAPMLAYSVSAGAEPHDIEEEKFDDTPSRACCFDRDAPLPLDVPFRLDWTSKKYPRDKLAGALYLQLWVDQINIAFKRSKNRRKVRVINPDSNEDYYFTVVVKDNDTSTACSRQSVAFVDTNDAMKRATFAHEVGHLLGAPHSLDPGHLLTEAWQRRRIYWRPEDIERFDSPVVQEACAAEGPGAKS